MLSFNKIFHKSTFDIPMTLHWVGIFSLGSNNFKWYDNFGFLKFKMENIIIIIIIINNIEAWVMSDINTQYCV